MWMNLQFVTQSEVSQKKKNKYYILMHLFLFFNIFFFLYLAAYVRWLSTYVNFGESSTIFSLKK